MSSLCFPLQLRENLKCLIQTREELNVGHPTFPMIVSFSPFFSFKINKNEQTFTCVVVQILEGSGAPFQIKPIFKMIFIKEFTSLCRKKLSEIREKCIISDTNETNMTQYFDLCSQKINSYLQLKILSQNNQINLEFSYFEQNIGPFSTNQKDVLIFLLFFLKDIAGPLSTLFQRMGTLKPSFCQKLKNNLKIEKQKKIIKRILASRKQIQIQPQVQQMRSQEPQGQIGVFQYAKIIKEEPINEDELTCKRGGYFNIVKRKLVVKKEGFSQHQFQCKIFAQKRLSKRKRPNTIFNYESKIPKELKFLECLNNLTYIEVNHFAKYYILDESCRIDLQSDAMTDQFDSMSKDSLSTASNQQKLGSITDVIYMDYYEENLDEYLARKGKLDAFEILSLVRQIFQSVNVLHKSGIIHRDIKPANFMVENLADGSVKTKLIDFGESTHVSSNYDSNQILGCSTQYAPLQCMYTCKEGFNCKQIDLWSVGVVVYKLTTGKMPVTYSKCFKSDIKHEWPTALNFFINQFGRGEWSMVENMLVQMALLFMKVKPEDRLNLKIGIKILDKIQKLVNQFCNEQISNL